jgi:DNA modification methylase
VLPIAFTITTGMSRETRQAPASAKKANGDDPQRELFRLLPSASLVAKSNGQKKRAAGRQPPLSEGSSDANSNVIQTSDWPGHGWYRFVLSYPPHLVRKYMDRFGVTNESLLLDPFCGTGTTLVEAKLLGVPSIGCDAHPFAVLVSQVKTNWSVSVRSLRYLSAEIVAGAQLDEAGAADNTDAKDATAMLPRIGLSADQCKLIPEGFVSPRPLNRLVQLRRAIDDATEGYFSSFRQFFYVAMAHTIANGAGNFAFGPEIYRTKPKADYDVVGSFATRVQLMIDELEHLQLGGFRGTESTVVRGDARTLRGIPSGVTSVITSPPYPNEKDYTRTTRVESLLLGLLADKKQLRSIKETLLRSNTRNVFIKDDDGDEVAQFGSIQSVCKAIEKRRVELEKTSGFEKLYHKVVAHYFGGMRRHFRALHRKLVPGAQLAYVVGDQLSFLMVPVPTAQLLAEVAEVENFEVVGCDLWRERTGTKIRNDVAGRKTVKVREEVLLLKKKE